MSRSIDAPGLRVAVIDDDTGLMMGLERRFASLRWDVQVLGYAVRPDQLAELRLHALVINPALCGVEYIERVAQALPGLAVLVCCAPAPLAERVRGLRSGADDWVTKPCHPEELVARIEAVIRRRRAGDLPLEEVPISAAELSVRPDRFDAFVGERAAGLSPKEFELLHQLALAEGRVLEREDVYQRVWGYTMARGDRSVDVFVRKLRKKLEHISPGWRYVHTHFGVGYRFAPELESETGAGGETEAAAGARSETELASEPATGAPGGTEYSLLVGSSDGFGRPPAGYPVRA